MWKQWLRFGLLAPEGGDGSGGDGSGGGGGGAGSGDGAGDDTGKGSGDGAGGSSKVSMLDDNGNFVEGWQDQLPEDLRPTAANYRTPADLVKAVKAGKQALSQRTEGLVKIPGKDATAEEVAAYHKAVGVPAVPEEYGLAKPTDALGAYYNEDEAKAFAAKALELKLNKEQASALMTWRLNEAHKIADAEIADGKKFFADREAALKDAWGQNFQVEHTHALRMLATMDHSLTEEDMRFLPAKVVIGLAGLAKKLGEDNLITSAQVDNKLKPSDVSNSIVNDQSHPDYKAYHDVTDPNHKAVVQKVLDGWK